MGQRNASWKLNPHDAGGEALLLSCCLGDGIEFDLIAELGDLGGQALGPDLGEAVLEIGGTEILVLSAVLEHVVDGGCSGREEGCQSDRAGLQIMVRLRSPSSRVITEAQR